MYVLACIPIYGDCGRDSSRDPAGAEENASELGVGYELAIKNAPLTESPNTGRLCSTNLFGKESLTSVISNPRQIACPRILDGLAKSRCTRQKETFTENSSKLLGIEKQSTDSVISLESRVETLLELPLKRGVSCIEKCSLEVIEVCF
jgi:hypothetical protein